MIAFLIKMETPMMSADGGKPELTSEQEADLKLARETMANIKQYMSLNEITDMSQLNKKH